MLSQCWVYTYQVARGVHRTAAALVHQVATVTLESDECHGSDTVD